MDDKGCDQDAPGLCRPLVAAALVCGVREHFLEERRAAVSQERETKKRTPGPGYSPRDGPEGGTNVTPREIIVLKGRGSLDREGDTVSNAAGATGSTRPNQTRWAGGRHGPGSEDRATGNLKPG